MAEYELWMNGEKADEIWFNGEEYTEVWTSVNGTPTLVWKKSGDAPIIGEWYTLNGLTERMTAITYGNGEFVAIGSYTYGILKDGSNEWIVGNHNLPPLSFKAIAYGNGVYVAVAHGGICVSADGMNWEYVEVGTFDNISFGNGVFVVIANLSSSTSGVSSIDGYTWTNNNMGAFLQGIDFGEDIFVSAGRAGRSRYSTDDGTTVYDISSLGSYTMNVVEYGNGMFASGGDYGVIKTYKKGDTVWNEVSRINTDGYAITGLLYFDDYYFMATWLDSGSAKACISKDNCKTWQSFNTLGDVTAYGNGRVVAVHSSINGISGAFDITYD